jgi:hypothetical protein
MKRRDWFTTTVRKGGLVTLPFGLAKSLPKWKLGARVFFKVLPDQSVRMGLLGKGATWNGRMYSCRLRAVHTGLQAWRAERRLQGNALQSGYRSIGRSQQTKRKGK